MTIDEIIFPLDLITVWNVYYIIVLCDIAKSKCLPSMRQSNPDHCFDK